MEKIEHIAYNSDETDNFKNELSLSKASIRKAIDIVNNMNTLDDHREKLEKLIKNEALIETQPSLEGTSTYADNTKGNAIYYGTGLATPKHPAIGLPFDVLGMVLVAEKIKRTLGLSDIYHHIADTHAKTNEWADAEAIDRRAHETQYILNLMADNLKLDGFHVMLSSEFDQSEEYKEILREFNGSDKHDYVKHEMADMEWYRKNHDVGLKTGWIIQATEAKLGADERLFDREYKKFKGDALSFIYTKPGRTFDASRPKASPYIQIPNEHRLLLDPTENVKEKFAKSVMETGDINLAGAKKHLQDIVRLYEDLYGSFEKGLQLEDKLQMMLDITMQGATPMTKIKGINYSGLMKETPTYDSEKPLKMNQLEAEKFLKNLEKDLLSEKDLSKLSAEEQYAIIADKAGTHQESITPRDDLLNRLKKSKETGEPLKIKYGVDPTGPDMHIGHAVGLIMLKRFEKMGHKIELLVGDFTARIGDPTDRKTERTAITDEDVKRNMESYFSQAAKIIDLNQETNQQVEMKYNSDWLGKIKLNDWIPLLQKISATRLFDRNDFQKRIASGGSVSMAELMYSLFMAYDSVVMEPDIELGGSDQFVNLHWCRSLMETHKQNPEIFVTVDLLPGVRGETDEYDRLKKMSKSAGNYISISETPNNMYAKTMSITDDVMWAWYKELTEISSKDLSRLKEMVVQGVIHPMEVKKMLSRIVVATFNHFDSKVIDDAEAAFGAKFGRAKVLIPDDVVKITTFEQERLLDALSAASGESKSTLRKSAGGIYILEDERYRPLSLEELVDFKISDSMIIKLGKRRYYQFVV